MTSSTWDFYETDEQQQQELDKTPKLPPDYKHNSIRLMKIAISDDEEPPTANKDKVSALVKRYDGDGRGTLDMEVKMYSKIEKKKPASSSLKTEDVLYGSGIKEGISKPGKPIPVPGKDFQQSRLSLAPRTGAGSKLPTQVPSKGSISGFFSKAINAILPGKPQNADTIVIDEERAREKEFCCLVSSVSVGHPQFISDVRPVDVPCRTNDQVELTVRRDWTLELNVRSGVPLLAGKLTEPPFVRLDKLHEKPIAVVCFTVANDSSLKARSEMKEQLIRANDFLVRFSVLVLYEGNVFNILNELSNITAEGKMEVKDFLMPRTRSVRDSSAQVATASHSNKRRASENDDDGKIQDKKVKSYTNSTSSFFYTTRTTPSSSGGRRSSVTVDMTGEEKAREKSQPEDPPHEPFRYLFRYPFDAHTNVITLSTEDSYRLNLGQFLNDSIIDFYLRYFYEERLPQETKDRSYVFNCFFYKRLVGTNKEVKATPKERYERVKSWTKKVNLFEKDFIIIPMHESAHWYLVIICYPRRLIELANRAEEMEKEVTEIVEIKEDEPPSNGASQVPDSLKDDDFEDVFDFDPNEAKKKGKQNNSEKVEVDSGADSPIKPTVRRLTTRSNAFNAEESPVRSRLEKKQERKFKEDIQESEKPFIFVMDSLGSGRPGALRHLKEYLVEEFKNTYPELPCDSSFIKGHSCKLPTQPNHCDCGVYVMHYVEMFLQSPDQIFEQLSVRQSMADWFSSEDITTKRGEVKSLMETLEKRYIEKKGDLNKQQETCVVDDDDIQIVG